MRAGKLRRLVTIQSPSFSYDSINQPVATWSDFAANLYAEIDETPGREQIQAGQVNPIRPVTITVRYVAGVTNQMRVVYGTRTFEIQTIVNPAEKNRELVLTCLEK